jgi:hypothetical protein
MVLLQLEGAMAEAKTIRELLQADFGNLWHIRHRIVREIKADPKLKHILARHGKAARDRQQEASLEFHSNKLPEEHAALQEIEDLLAEPEPEIEKPDSGVTSELLEIRSRRRG